ncbi:N(G),N(G)-dimethylarginine dimethylaminohydrolase [Porphyridium purpureum]|uniref:N(G),N(G)-dimethylarginine dimethylaminohydrolase n=1 Tax=Porphyridium purpureum TaxID=35688 RepID=A0A5J4ZAJ8_PORPP|nr:N(G),N(G)-dimethylarginine dimethylaminohydrolase [Porphyridium purpureum]|eukprot:POR9279..scf295_1
MASHLLPTITRILMRRPAQNAADGITSVSEKGVPNYDLMLQQYDAYVSVLRSAGLDVQVLEPDARFPDGHFVEDPLVIFRDLVFLCKSGAAARRDEGESLLQHLPPHLTQCVVRMQDEKACLDGGDVLFCSDRVLIGTSERTNLAGARALRDALVRVQPDLRVDFVPFSGVLHLKTGVTELAPNVLVRDPALTTSYDFSWAAQIITLPPEEGYAADVMPLVGRDMILIVDGHPTLRRVAEKYYAPHNVVALEMSEFEKMDGGLTCLSLRF